MALYKFQKNDILEWHHRGRRGILGWEMGTGKGQPYGSKVLTEYGWKNIEDLFVGLKVCASDGKFYNVSGVYPKQEIDTYKFTYSDGVSLTFDKDHLHIAKSLKDRHNKRDWRVLPTTYFLDKQLIRKRANGHNKVYNIPIVSPIERENLTLPVDPYILGILLGDGCLRHSASFTNNDEFIVNRIKRILNPDLTLSNYGSGEYRIKGIHRENTMLDGLKQLKLIGCYSRTKFIPEIYQLASHQQRLDLLHGIMDTDGYVESGTALITTTSSDLKDGVMELARSFGGLPTYTTKNPAYTYNGERKSGRTAYIIRLGKIDVNPFSLPRKRDMFQEKKHNTRRFIESIEYAGKQKTVCISVDSPDHSYVTEHHVVTHNTYIGARIVRNSLSKKETVLIVVPPALKTPWEEELQSIGVETIGTAKKQHNVTLVSYSMLSHIDRAYTLVIADECHYIKNYSSKRGKLFREIANQSRDLLLMSGTLSQHRDSEELLNYLWCINSQEIRERLPQKITHFRNKYSSLISPDGRMRWYVTGKQGAALVDDLIKKHSWFRKTSDVLNLPPYVEKTLSVKSELSWKDKVQQLEDEMKMRISDAYEKPHLAHALQLANGIDFETGEVVNNEKFKVIEELISDTPERDPVIVWIYWRSFGIGLLEYLRKNKVDCELINGSTSDTERTKILSKFKEGKLKVLIASMGTIAEGHNLQHCNYTIYGNIWYDSTRFEQSKARTYRNGQKRTTFNYLVVGKGTIERDVLHVLREKLRLKEAEDYLNSIMLNRYFGKVEVV